MHFLKEKFGTLVLASESPRRSVILRQAGFDFTVCPSGIDEIYMSAEPVDIAVELAEKKARHVSDLYPEQIVLGADTIVVLDHHILGKPNDRSEAYTTLSLLSGRTHQVYTAICLIQKKRNLSVNAFACTDVTFRRLKNEEIYSYIDTGSPMDKAGAYGIQDGSAVFIERIHGDFYNVVGLPVTLLYQTLHQHFNHRENT